MLQANIHRQRLHETAPGTYSVNGLSDIELRWLYENQLVRQGRKARHVYDHIKTNALHGLCSYCQYGTANTLDHFIPVSVVQALSIDPWNLVPACDRCNKLLLATFATQTEQQLLHPYAQPQSVPTDLRWLRASVQRGMIKTCGSGMACLPANMIPVVT
ncbi:HNH endonuclease [Gordonia bronchialis]|uniref:HNH endonuclease n=1 Tax=Gordonia bronchialis TaxID=2054 RepID=UPI0039840A09